MLSLCATPIGNMEDVTLRVLRALREADEIWCEDTRHTMPFLERYGIRKPLVSCHEHNERRRAEDLLPRLREGKRICYVSDAGMPGISDPGAVLIDACLREGLAYEVLPGASAALMSVVYAGMGSEHFTFYGFLPRTGKERREAIDRIARESWPVILYESPHRVRATLSDLFERIGDADACVLRELTKKFECARRGKLSELAAFYAEEPKGECVILVDPSASETQKTKSARPEDVIRQALADGLSSREAAEAASGVCGIPKREAYAMAVRLREESGEG